MGTDDEEAEHQRIMMMQMAQIEEQNRLVDEANAKAKAKGLSGAIISSMNSDDDEAMKAIQEAQEAARLEAAEEEAKKEAKKEAEDHAVMETLLKAADEAEEAKLAAEKKMKEEGLAAEREREKAARKLEAERLAKEQKEMDEAAEKARLAALKKLELAEEKEKDRLEALAEEQRQKDEASETSRLEAEEAERLAAEQKQAEEEKAKQEAAERIRKQEETAKKIAEERKRNEAELMRIKEEARKKSAEEEQAKIKELEAEKAAEQQRQKEAAEEKAKLEAQEAERLVEEQLQKEVEEANARIEAEKAAAKLIEEERLATEKRQKAEADAAAKAQAEKMTAMKVAEEEAARLVSEEAAKAEEEKILLEEETKRAEEALELEAQMADIADIDSDAEDLPHGTINNELPAADGEDDEVAKLAEEMRKEMEKMGQDNDDNKEEEMEIDFGATVDEIVTPPASLTHSNGKVSEFKLSINEKTKEKPFVFPKAGKVTSKASSPSVRSKEVRVTPSFFPKSKAAKSSDMKKPSTRPTVDPGKLRVNTMASSAPLPRVATMSTPPRGNKHRSTLSKPRPESSHSKSSTPLPRVATLPSPARGQSLAPPDRLPPKSPASLFGIMPRSQTKTPSNTLPRMLSPRDGPRCPTRYNPELHGSKGACERCLELSSDDEKEKFQITGHHIRIMIVSGGCDRSCLLFPRDDTQPPVRLCKKCYFDTHRTMYDAMEIVPAPVER